MRLPSGLGGPVEVALARQESGIPHPESLAGGAAYEPKWDGFRLVAVRDERVRLWSSRGNDLTDRFPDVADAVAAHLQPGTVLDGEVVMWDGDHLDFLVATVAGDTVNR